MTTNNDIIRKMQKKAKHGERARYRKTGFGMEGVNSHISERPIRNTSFFGGETSVHKK